MNKQQKPRGTIDYYGLYQEQFQNLCNFFIDEANKANYELIKTPMFEFKEIFLRTLGEETDLVQKEFFITGNLEKQEYVLKPENTAPIMRMVANEKLVHKFHLPLKFFYLEPMFRYERPQAGRLRQFHQFGVEIIGANHYFEDLELLTFVNNLFTKMNISNIKLKINYLGGTDTKIIWAKKLTNYFQKFLNQLSEINQKRVFTNPIRILDDKDNSNLEFIRNAPKMSDFLTSKEKENFILIQQKLKELNIVFEIDNDLVRGFDYYQGLIFEFIYLGNCLKGQNTICGGGRYQKILTEFNEDDFLCLGFAIGIERLLIVLNEQKILIPIRDQLPKIYLVNLIKNPSVELINFINDIRKNNIIVITNWNINKIEKHFKEATKNNAEFVLIYGHQEEKEKKIIFKHEKTKFQIKITFNEVNKILKEVAKLKNI